MCTVTLIARKRGYLLGMNRDEKLARPVGRPPALRTIGGRSVLCPSEPSGGTWISLSDAGVTFALINWYSVATRPGIGQVSRGQIVSAVSPFTSPAEVADALAKLPLRQVRPFRLIGIFPTTKTIIEWRSDSRSLKQVRHRWQTQQWISSGFDEPTAQRIRSQTFRAALRQKTFGSAERLRRLHRSHHPTAGPFSTCMHRPDAATVSYTEAAVIGGSLALRHQLGCPHQRQSLREYHFQSPQ